MTLITLQNHEDRMWTFEDKETARKWLQHLKRQIVRLDELHIVYVGLEVWGIWTEDE